MKKNKRVIYNPEALDIIIKGVDLVANPVKVTLGPKGRNVILSRDFGGNHVTKDGVTVAKDIRSSDPAVEVGCQLIREVAMKTNDEVGDGTSTSVILAQDLIHQGRLVLNNNCSTTDLMKGLKLGLEKSIEFIKLKSTKIETSTDLERIAMISANNDEFVGSCITKALNFVGLNGVITVDNSKLPDTTVTLVDGLEIDRGFMSPRFINNNSKNSCELENVKILVTSADIVDGRDLVPVLSYCIESKSSLLLMANSISGDVLQFLVLNSVNKKVITCVVNPPSFGDDRTEVLKDIAALTSATFVDKFEYKEPFSVSQLGIADKAIITKDTTTIIGGNRSSEVDIRLNNINSLLEDQQITKLTRDLLIARKGRIEGKLAVINVGGGSEVEQAELRDRVDDALCATKVAIRSGWVPGAGTTLYAASLYLDSDPLNNVSEGIRMGYNLVKSALKVPFTTLCKNCDITLGSIANMIALGECDYGYDLLNDVPVTEIEHSVIDPTEVTITALSNAVSIAGTILTTECIVCDEEVN